MIDKNRLIQNYTDGVKVGKYVYVKHKKRETEYIVDNVVQDATNKNDGGWIVIYREMDKSLKYWAREINEFCDGRFEIID